MAEVSSLRSYLRWAPTEVELAYIDVSVVPLKKLFSGEFVFSLAKFQRAYGWQEQQVGQLLGDMFDALDSGIVDAKYFLGTLLIAENEGQSGIALIDGHQRTMTLTILFSVLRDLSTNPDERLRLAGFVKTSEFHLQPQALQAEFLREFVQQDGATNAQPDGPFESLSFTEQNIIRCRDYIREILDSADVTAEKRSLLGQLLAQRCFVIVHRAPSEEEGWARLEKEEKTRLPFTDGDRAKNSVLSLVPANERFVCTKKWEQAEQLTGTIDLYRLLNHLKNLKRRGKRKKPLEEDLALSYELNVHALRFMDDILLPAAKNLNALRQGRIGPAADRKRISQLCEFMNWIDEESWLGPALIWIREHGEHHPDSLEFFKRLERLYWLTNLAGNSQQSIPARMMQIIRDLEKGNTLESYQSLAVSRKIKLQVIECLKGKKLDQKKFGKQSLRRVMAAMGEDPGVVDGETVTVEHILPRGWAEKNDWRRNFKNRDDVLAYAHTLGNLAFLTREDNAHADCNDFAVKKPIYAKSNFRLTRDLAKNDDWTPAVIVNRREQMIAALFEDWELTLP